MGKFKYRIRNFARIFGLLALIIILGSPQNSSYKTNFCRQRQIYKVGVATYYGGWFNNRLTSSGQIFNENKFTAASRDLPFGTILRVKNLENGREVIVLVNDRGPVKKTLILDLSKIVAIHLGMVKKGSAKVELEILSSSPNPLEKIFEVYRNLPNCSS